MPTDESVFARVWQKRVFLKKSISAELGEPLANQNRIVLLHEQHLFRLNKTACLQFVKIHAA
jgi:hypothetical protein